MSDGEQRAAPSSGGVGIRDAAERNQIEDAFPGLLDAAQDAVLAVDERGLIHLVNRRAEALLGYSRDELIGQPLHTLTPERGARGVHPDHRAANPVKASSRPMAHGVPPSVRRKDGTEVDVDISLSSLETEHGLLVTATVRDITARRHIEMERALLDEVVASAWDEERGMFEAQLQQAQRLESVGQLAGGIAHDFNNLLAGIMNYAGLVSAGLTDEMERRCPDDHAAFVTMLDDVAEIIGVAQRAAALTHQLLMFSRRTVAQPEVLDLSNVVAEMEELLRRTIGENVDHLHTELATGLPFVTADRSQLEQVIMNLAVNARDAMPGGGELTIETCAHPTTGGPAGEAQGTTSVRLIVSDTGSGMPKEVVDRAFEPFFTTKAEGHGTGLGLATVYGIVTQAGGRVAILSTEGVGTTVAVDLPPAVDVEAPQRASQPGAARSGNGETVLLVEDDRMVREPARRMLERNGYRVLTAASAPEALEIALAHDGAIDLLLTDVVMPGRSGKELSVDLAPLRPAMKVLFTSGYSSNEIIARGGLLEPGVNLLPKPSSADEMLRKIREVLEAQDR